MTLWITDTSQGRVALSFEYMPKSIGTTVALYRVDGDGWATPADVGSWSRSRDEDEDLSGYIQRVLELPAAEADDLARRGLELWQERHGERSDMSREDWFRAGSILTLTFGLIFLALLALAAGAIWLLVELI